MNEQEADDLNRTIRIWDEQYISQEKARPVGIQYPTEALVIFVSNLRKGRDLQAYFDDKGSEQSIKRDYSGVACEIGFGSTANLRLLRDKGFSVVGLEVSAEAASRGRDHLDKLGVDEVELKVWEPYEIPYPEQSFKLVCGLQCLYYNLDIDRVVDEVYRTLEPGGSFIFSFFSTDHTYIKYVDPVEAGDKVNIRKWSDSHPNERIRGARFWQPDSKAVLEKLFSRFQNVRVFTTESDQTPMFESWWYVCGEK